MVESLGRHAMAAAIVLTLGGPGGVAAGTSGAAAARASAQAVGFSAAYTCSVPMLGARTVTISGALTASPGQAVVGRATRFHLQISGLSMRAPVTIDSWSATAQIDISGAQTTSFELSGSGGSVPAYQPVTGDLVGDWVPSASGTVQLRGGKVVLKASTSFFGEATASCAPNDPRPVIASLTVTSPGRTGLSHTWRPFQAQ